MNSNPHMSDIPQRGGAREGAGRKKTGKLAEFRAITIRVKPEMEGEWKAALAEVGISGPQFLRKLLDLHKSNK